MLKTSESTEFTTRLREGGVKVGGNSRCKPDRNEAGGSEVDSGEVADDEVGKKDQKTSKNCLSPKK